MLSPRWQKLWRDLWLTRGRTTMMVIAIAVSIFGVGAVLTTYSTLTREISRNYLGTNPASATLEMDKVDDALVAAVRGRPGIADAEARASVTARVQVGPDTWRPLVLFVVKDMGAMRVSTFRSDGGAWPPPTGTMLVERTALPMVEARLGETVVVKTPNGPQHQVLISGVVHDPALAPAWQERMGYGYITPATLAWLGEKGDLDELKIVVSEQVGDAVAVERTARELAGWLQQQGHEVHEIQIPPPLKHPHQNQMVAVLLLLLIFSLMALVLSAILVATMISGLLAVQIRQIGVMKAVGAQTRQIAGLYVVMILVISAAALALGCPAGVAAGRAFSAALAELLNITLYSQAIPWWVFGVQVVAGLLVPLLVALGPIARGSRITVREAIADFGVSQERAGGRGLDAVLGGLRGLDRSLLLALRNTFRRRGRLLLTLGLLAAGGAMFMTGLNVKAAWGKNLDDSFATRRYDLEIRLSRPEPVESLIARISSLPGVKNVEAWGYAPTALARPGVIDVVRTYPDGGHGSFSLRAGPAETTLVKFPVLAGRRLQPGDTDALVLNQLALAQLPDVTVGDTLSLSLDGRGTAWRVVGIVREIGPASAYVTTEGFDRVSGHPGSARSLRIVTAEGDLVARGQVIQAIERTLTEANVSVAMVMADSVFRTALGEHIAILIFSLVAMAVVMAVVGVLGLMSTMSTNMAERTREFGVMQTIGATPHTVIRIVVSEGVFIGVLSWIIAVPLALPLSALVGTVTGNLAFRAPLPLVVSPFAVLLWLAITIIGSAAASALPAWRASRLTVRETLAYV
ncbi:MAG TPA: FtsX-like permease family protein [Symbiobacteriaceae bacterium]|jgi:putative ABC transport system permease protein